MAYGYSYGPPGEHQKAKEAEASSMDGEPKGFFCACHDYHGIIGDGDDNDDVGWWSDHGHLLLRLLLVHWA